MMDSGCIMPPIWDTGRVGDLCSIEVLLHASKEVRVLLFTGHGAISLKPEEGGVGAIMPSGSDRLWRAGDCPIEVNVVLVSARPVVSMMPLSFDPTSKPGLYHSRSVAT